MKKSLFYKIFSGYLIVILVAFILGFIIFSNILYNFYIKQLNERLYGIAWSIRSHSMEIFDHDLNAAEELRAISDRLGLRITIIEKNGRVAFDTEMDHRIMDNHLNRAEVVSSMENDYGFAVRWSTSLDHRLLYHAVNVAGPHSRAGFIRISIPVTEFHGIYRQWIIRILFPGAVSVFISLLIALYISKGVSDTVNGLKSFFYKIKAGEYHNRIILKNDELDTLYRAINEMLETFEKYKDSSNDDALILDLVECFGDAAVLINMDDSIIARNEKFTQYFALNEINKKYWEIFRDSSLIDIIEKTKKDKNSKRIEISHKERSLLCSSVFVRLKRQVMLIFIDVSEINFFERYKKEFYTNISHELKTPLTAIKGFAETLYGEVQKQHKPYVATIQRHADRLNNIVQDLICISGIENYEDIYREKFENVNIKEIIDSVLPLFKDRAQKKGLKLKIGNIENISLRGDANTLEQLLINLIDNAVKYTQKGDVRISVTAHDEDKKNIMIRIEDTGSGIPSSDIKRIFERFFVVEKGRSKTHQGTGLGLAIAQRIADLHGGRIEAESQLNHGSVFTVILPANYGD